VLKVGGQAPQKQKWGDLGPCAPPRFRHLWSSLCFLPTLCKNNVYILSHTYPNNTCISYIGTYILMPYSTPIKSMHIACILCYRICRYCKATSSVQPHRFWVSYKHDGAYITHSVIFLTFLWFFCLHALHTLNLVWPLYIYVHFGFLLSAALQFTPISEPALFRNHVHCASRQRCSFITLTLAAQRRASAQRCSSPLKPLFTTFTASHHRFHRVPWCECRTASPRS